jgi:hypothetical protein
MALTKVSQPMSSTPSIDDNGTATALTIDSSGNIGIGVTPSAWWSSAKALQVAGSTGFFGFSGVNGNIVTNTYYDGSNYRYLATSAAYLYEQSGGHKWSIAPSGTAGDTTTFTQAMRITALGFTQHSNTGTYDAYSGADEGHQFVSDNASHSTLWVTNTNASNAQPVLYVETARGATDAFDMFTCTTGNLADDQFRLRADGNAYADGSWNGGGADYAEYFEWSDGNTSNEDRRGYTVVLEGNKIRKSTNEDNSNHIIGVVSANPSVVGDSDIGSWKNKYQKDDYGSYIKDENGERIINDEYDETQDYTTREDRQEWAVIGLMGKVRINKGQAVGDRWIKMRDISDAIEEWLIK